VDDAWIPVADGDPLPAQGAIIVSLKRWREERADLIARADGLAVRLAPADHADAIAADLPLLALIALEFPTFRDGRAYSTARLLRERFGFKGELRAVGNVLRDQLLFMHRCGFDAFEIKDAAALDDWKRAMNEISVFYQPTVDSRASAVQLRQRQRAQS
jgi:uncharacterized protein (DUF934 family)